MNWKVSATPRALAMTFSLGLVIFASSAMAAGATLTVGNVTSIPCTGTYSTISAAVAAASPAGSSHTAGASPAAATSLSSWASWSSFAGYGQGASLGIYQKQILSALCRHTHLEKRMASRSECYQHLYWRPVSSTPTFSTIRAAGAVCAISAGTRIVRVNRPGAAVHTVRSIHSVETAGAFAAGEICAEVAVVTQGNIEIDAQIGMAGHCDGDVR